VISGKTTGIGAAVTAVIALGLWVAGDRQPNALDGDLLRWTSGTFAHEGALLHLFVLPTEPYVLLSLIALMVLVCVAQRRWDGVILCLAGTALPVAINTWVLKPLFDRPLKDYLAYPSGHTVSLVATLTVLVVLARPGAARAVTAAVAAVVTVMAGIGLVGSGYHYPVDVVGGACFAIAAVLTTSIPLGRRRVNR
jgi:membrane-associated phospholipid phosphatase